VPIYRAQRRFIGPNTHQPELPHRVTLSRSEGSVAMGLELLRGVYTERSECAQQDRVALSP